MLFLMKNIQFAKQNNSETIQLQFLRFCAFLLVFLYHSTLQPADWMPGAGGAGCAVSLFFILSGAVAGISSFDREIQFSVRSIVGLIIKKLKKIYPLYFVTVLLTISRTCIPTCVSNHDLVTPASDLMQLLRSLLLIQSWHSTDYYSFNGVGWFLSTLFFLYLFQLPLLACCSKIKKHKNSSVFFSAIIVIVFLLNLLYGFLLRNTNTEYWLYIFPPSRMGEYVIGICLSYLAIPVKRQLSECHNCRLLLSAAELLSLVLWVFSMYMPIPEWQAKTIHWIVPNSILLIVFILGKGVLTDIFRFKPLVILGNISFECYLLHQIVIHDYFINSGVGLIHLSRIGNAFNILLCLLITILLAFLISTAEKKRPE